MIDYIKTLNYITDTLIGKSNETPSTLSCILFLSAMIIIFLIIESVSKNAGVSIIVTICMVLSLMSALQKPILYSNIRINTQILKEQNITETIDTKLLSQIYHLNIKKDGVILDLGNNSTHYGNFTLSAILNHINVKSINNLCSNIIYLNDYYANHYQSESKYDWINQKLNEFYTPNNNINVSTDEVLSNLKN